MKAVPGLAAVVAASFMLSGCVLPPSQGWVDDLRAEVRHVEVRSGWAPDQAYRFPVSWDPDANESATSAGALADRAIHALARANDAYKEVGINGSSTVSLHQDSLHLRIQLYGPTTIDLVNREGDIRADRILIAFAIESDDAHLRQESWTHHIVWCSEDHCNRLRTADPDAEHDEMLAATIGHLEMHGLPTADLVAATAPG